jgi:hypothetical protein
MITTNTTVKTPLGDGIAQAPAFSIRDGQGNDIVQGVLVRLPINDATRSHMKKSNCLTPQATLSGLWVFQVKELS